LPTEHGSAYSSQTHHAAGSLAIVPQTTDAQRFNQQRGSKQPPGHPIGHFVLVVSLQLVLSFRR